MFTLLMMLYLLILYKTKECKKIIVYKAGTTITKHKNELFKRAMENHRNESTSSLNIDDESSYISSDDIDSFPEKPKSPDYNREYVDVEGYRGDEDTSKPPLTEEELLDLI